MRKAKVKNATCLSSQGTGTALAGWFLLAMCAPTVLYGQAEIRHGYPVMGKRVVAGADRYAYVNRGPEGAELLLFVEGVVSGGPLPGKPDEIVLGRERNIVMVRRGKSSRSKWVRIFCSGNLQFEFDSTRDLTYLTDLAPTGEWFAVQPVILDYSKEYYGQRFSTASLTVYRWDGSKVREIPGLRKFSPAAEVPGDNWTFSRDGEVLVVFRLEPKTIDIYNLRDSRRDMTIHLAELDKDVVFSSSVDDIVAVNTDRIVLRAFNMGGVDWVRVLHKNAAGDFVSQIIIADPIENYLQVEVSDAGSMLLVDFSYNYEYLNPDGELVWRWSKEGGSEGRNELASLLPEIDFRRGWSPRLMPSGDILMQSQGGGGLLLRLSDEARESNKYEAVLGTQGESPRARIEAVAVLEVGAKIDPSGRYLLKQGEWETRPIQMIDRRQLEARWKDTTRP